MQILSELGTNCSGQFLARWTRPEDESTERHKRRMGSFIFLNFIEKNRNRLINRILFLKYFCYETLMMIFVSDDNRQQPCSRFFQKNHPGCCGIYGKFFKGGWKAQREQRYQYLVITLEKIEDDIDCPNSYFQSMKQAGSPKKQYHSPDKKKLDASTGSETEPSIKKYKPISADISVADSNHPQSKKSSDLGLIEGQESDDEEAQNTHVEVDLFKGIMLMAKSKQLAAISGLTGAFAIHLIVGAIYRWNMIAEYVGIYYQTNRITPIGAPLSMLCAGLTMRLGAKISESLGSRVVLCFGMLLAGLSIIFASLTDHFASFLLFNNVLYGLSAGLLFLPPLLECHKFFPKLKLITNSIVLTGTGLGAVLFGAANIECIEQDNQTTNIPYQELKAIVDTEFSSCFLQMGWFVLLIGLMGVVMMIPMILKNEERQREQRELSMEQKDGNFCQSECESFKSRVFWMLALIIFLTSCGNYYIIMNFKNLLAVQHQQKAFLYWILISGALGNGLPRLCWGFLFSRIGFKTLFCVIVGMTITSFIVIMATNNHAAYITFYTINSVALGGMMVICPNVSMIIFGKKIGDKVYSYYWIAFSLSNFFQFAITLILTNNPVTSDDYSEVLFFFSLCVIVALLVCVRERLQGPWKNSLDLVEFKRVKKQRKSSM